MAEIALYHYSGCSSCRSAERVLAERGASIEKRDLFADRLSSAELVALFNRIGAAPPDMLSRRSRPFRELELAERTLTDGEIVALMAEYPALIRRPIVIAGSRGQVGYNRTAIERLLAAEE